MPPCQVIRRPGSSSVTFTGKARPGFTSETTLSFSPATTRPSTLFTPDCQWGQDGASARIPQILPGSARISTSARYSTGFLS
jgi:hypothetical protein